ncbi:MAG: hypothetical protein MI723_18710 [Caulobacterales bacterium]|nr:hypothetical protein [Caulobacterales bacterium]
MMKTLAAAAMIAALSAPAFAQGPATSIANSNATIGAQVNDLYGYGNTAANAAAIDQHTTATAFDHPEWAKPMYEGGPRASYPGGTAGATNTGTIGAQVNTLQGYGNTAFNEAAILQSGAATASGHGTALVDQNATIGAQVNTILGEHNTAANSALIHQNGSAHSH